MGKFVILFWLFVLEGCAQHWEKLGGTQQEFDATEAGCRAQSYIQFPVINNQVQTRGGYTSPINTSCRRDLFNNVDIHCTSTGGIYTPPAYMNVDINDNARASAIESCLYAHGWSKATRSSSQPQIYSDQPGRLLCNVGGNLHASTLEKCRAEGGTIQPTVSH